MSEKSGENEAESIDSASRDCTEHKVNDPIVLLDVVFVCVVCLFLFVCLLYYHWEANEFCVCYCELISRNILVNKASYNSFDIC